MKQDNILDRRGLVIAGPCSAESREQLLTTATQLAQTGRVDALRAGLWKPRTKPDSFEGVGKVGLEWLAEAKRLTGLPIATEVATAEHVELALAAGVDILWLGARTTSNPFSVQEVADALRGAGSEVAVLIKNPTTSDIELWCGAVERIAGSGIEQIGLVHRGFAGYAPTTLRNAPLWQIPLEMRQRMPQLPMLCDPSHICGNRTGLRDMAQQAADLDYNGLMIESHYAPDSALSDAQQQITPTELAELLSSIVWRSRSTDRAADYQGRLDTLRGTIDRLDEQIFSLLAERMEVAEQIGRLKQSNNLTILQSGRWGEVVERVLAHTRGLNLSDEFVRRVLESIHLESIERQKQIINNDK